jgi:TPR repeat protein
MARTKGTIKVDARKTTAAGKKEAKRVAKRVLAAKKKKDACVLCDKALRYMYDEKKQDLNKARKLYQQAAKMGHADAMVNLGILLQDKGDVEQAEEWYRKSAAEGNSVAMSNLGVLLEKRGDLEQAEEWYRKSAAEGESIAMYNLGVRLQDKGDVEQAEEWYRKSAAEGDSVAMINLGFLLQDKGDVEQAEEWYRKSATEGESAAMTNLGILLEDRGDVEQAEEWYRKSATEGNSAAMTNLGILLEKRGDLEQAEEWYRKSATEGVTPRWYHRSALGSESIAMNKLGLLLEKKGDVEQAEEWYRKSAAQGYCPWSIWNLITLYRKSKIPIRHDDVRSLYQRVSSLELDFTGFENEDEERAKIATNREWCEKQFESMQAPAVSMPSSTILGKRRPIHTEAADTRTSAVVLYRNTTKKPRVESTPEMRKSLATKIRKEMEQCRQKLDKVQAMNDDQIQQLYDDDSGSDLEGYPDEERRDDADKKWCNQQVLQAALTTPGRIVVLDAKYFGTSRTLIAGGVAATRITCPQLDAKTLDDMREEKTRDESLTDINLQEGSLGFHLDDAMEASIGVVFADYTGMWHSGPKIDMINLLENNKMRTDGKVFVTITLQRQGVESIFDAALDMLGGVFGPRGWSMFTSKTYKRMAFVGFRKSD